MEEKNSTKNSSEYGRKNFPMVICKNVLLEFRWIKIHRAKGKLALFLPI